MGNQNTKLTPEFQKGLEFYAFTKEVEDYRFGKGQVWTKKGTPKDAPAHLALVKEKWSMNESEFVKTQDYMKKRSMIHDEFLTDVIASSSHTDSSWCSKYYKTLVAMEYSEENLGEELHRRRRLTRDDPGKWMSEPELWYVIRAIANGSEALLVNGLLHGDIQPRNILIMPDETIKLFEAPLLTQYFNGFTRMLQEQDYCAALSPEELDALRSDYLYRSMNPGIVNHQPVDRNISSGIENLLHSKKEFSQANATNTVKRYNLDESFPDYSVRHKHNEKDEVFSIGITALCCATNNPVADFYDLKSVSLNKEHIAKKLQFMRELNYSPQLTQLVEALIREDPNTRPTLADIRRIVDQPHNIIGANGQVIGQSAAPRPHIPLPAGAGGVIPPQQQLPPQGQGAPGQFPPQGQGAPGQFPPQGQGAPGQFPPQRPAQPLNPGMAAFQSGVPQYQPNPSQNTTGYAGALPRQSGAYAGQQSSFTGQPSTLNGQASAFRGQASPQPMTTTTHNPGMSAFQAQSRPTMATSTIVTPGQPTAGFNAGVQGARPGMSAVRTN